ncbi:hypothetical protein BH09ACT8_BH09ACT8_60170 [soil metagenome]
MSIPDLTTHAAGLSATGGGALLAAWLAWRWWRRVLRTIITCVAVAVVVYVAFPDVAQRLVQQLPQSAGVSIDR